MPSQALPGINAHARRFPLAGAQSGAWGSASGKRAVVRHIFREAESSGFDAAMDDDELEFQCKMAGTPPPGSSARVGKAKQGGWLAAFGNNRDEVIMLGVVGLVLVFTITLAGGLFYFLLQHVK